MGFYKGCASFMRVIEEFKDLSRDSSLQVIVWGVVGRNCCFEFVQAPSPEP